MAGVISPSMPVWVVRTPTGGNRAYSNLNEGLGKVLRFGANGRRGARAPALDGSERSRRRCGAAFEALGGLELKPLMAQALHMGDEVHNRNAAATSLLFKRLAPALLEVRGDAPAMPPRRSSSSPATTTSSSTCRWPPARRCSMPRTACRGSTMVTAMARNGVDFGIRLSGTGDALVHGARANPVDGLYFPGYTARTRRPTSATARSPRPPGSAASRWRRRRRSSSSSAARPRTRSPTRLRDDAHHARRQPRVHAAGARLRRHARRHRRAHAWSTRGMLPIINTGIAHSEPGVGQIGAGITPAPMACFTRPWRCASSRERLT